jgi:hypothetical protein
MIDFRMQFIANAPVRATRFLMVPHQQIKPLCYTMISTIGVNDCFEIFVHVHQPQFDDETIIEVHNAYHCAMVV